jgi:hypothetical protein
MNDRSSQPGISREGLACPESLAPAKRHWCMGSSLALTLALLPLYRFSSGGPQWVDVPLVFLLAAALLTKCQPDGSLQRLLFPLVLFGVWTISINTVYFVLYPDEFRYLIKNVEVAYLILIVYALFFIINDLLNSNKLTYLYLGLFLSAATCLMFKGNYNEVVRLALSFNNPNQLGYFSVLLMCYATLLIHWSPSIFKNIFYIGVAVSLVILAHYFALLSLSRGAILSVLVLDTGLLFNSARKISLGIISLLAALALVIVLLCHPTYMENQLTARQGRSFFASSESADVKGRLTVPFNLMEGFHVIIGMGDVPFSHAPSLWGNKNAVPEVHNIFGNVFRSYGAIGLALFGWWIFRLIWASRVITGGLFVWASILLYNMAHNGIRFRGFWILVALMIVMIKHKNEKVGP